jgi:anti-sigma B factor antagonist
MNAIPNDPPGCEVACISGPGFFIVAVQGEIDLATAQQFEAGVLDGIDTPEALVIDLTECEFMDSTGISVLIRARSGAAGREGRLAIACDPAGPIARLLRLAADGLFDVYESRETALAAKAAPRVA